MSAQLGRADGGGEIAITTAQRTWVTFARVFLGAWWVVEATIGRFWKWGWFGSGVNPDWLGETAGATILSTAERAQDDGVWPWYGWVLDNLLVGNAELWSWLTSIGQVLIGVALILGLFTRVAALSGLAMLVSILLMGSFRTSPLLIALSLFVLLTGAERFLSLDRRLAGTAFGPLTDLGLGRVMVRFGQPIIVAAGGIGTYFVLQQATRPAPRFIYVGQELAVFCFAIIAGYVMVTRNGFGRLTAATGLLRMYVGYKLLWWVWTAPQVSLTSLPGFNDGTELGEVMAGGAETHLPVLGALVDNLLVDAAGPLAFVFGLAQIAIGSVLLLGWRARTANWAALGLLGLYVILGFTRYAPYLAGMALITLALGSAPQIGLGRLISNRGDAAAAAWRFSPRTANGLAVGAMVLVALAVVSGITPNGYSSDVGSTILWTLGLDALVLAGVALLGVRARNDDEHIVDLRDDPEPISVRTGREPAAN